MGLFTTKKKGIKYIVKSENILFDLQITFCRNERFDCFMVN